MPARTGGARPGPAPRRKKRYRFTKKAIRFYKRLGVSLAVLVVSILILRLTVFSSTISLKDYDPEHPMDNIAKSVLDTVKPKADENLIIMDMVFRCDYVGAVTYLEMDFAEITGEDKYREWKLTADEKKAKLHKGKVEKGNRSTSKGRFPSLPVTMATVSGIPFSELARAQNVQNTQYLEFDTKNHHPNYNAEYSGKVPLDAQLAWIPLGGQMNLIEDNFRVASEYMAVDCYLCSTGSDVRSQRYMILLQLAGTLEDGTVTTPQPIWVNPDATSSESSSEDDSSSDSSGEESGSSSGDEDNSSKESGSSE